MKAKELYSEEERKVIENQFLNYFLQNLYYRRIDYYNKKNKISKTKEILTDNIEKEYLKNSSKVYSQEDNILHQSYCIIDIDLIENMELYRILSEFSELEMKVLNLLIVNCNTQQEVAKYLNVSQPRISDIKKNFFKTY